MDLVTGFLREHAAQLIYSVIVLIFFTGILLILLKTLRQATETREKRLKSRKMTPLGRPPKGMRGKAKSSETLGIDSIEKQFTITRKILIPLIMVFAILLSITPFLNNVPAALVSLFAAVLSLILGIAAKPFLENIFAGLVISYSRSLNIGDTVVLTGVYGTVEDINLSHTTIKTWDWKRYIIPNIKMMQQDFLNHSLQEKYQWATVEFWVSYENDPDRVENLALKCARESAYHVSNDEPEFWIMEMDKEGLLCWLAVWAASPSDAWTLKNDVRTRLVKEFRRHGITIHAHRHLLEGPAAPKPDKPDKPDKPA